MNRPLQSRYYGLIVDLLPTLFQTAGLGNYTLEFYNSTNSGGAKLPNGTWTGTLPMLFSGAEHLTHLDWSLLAFSQ